MSGGRLPKAPEQRRRRNRTATTAVLVANDSPRIPDLPVANPHPQTARFWADLVASPLSTEYLDVDVHGLEVLASLVEDYWRADNPTMRIALSREIRLLSAEYGLSPIARRRLQLTISRTAASEERRASRPRRRDPRPEAHA